MSRKSLIVVVAAMALPMAAWPGAASNLAVAQRRASGWW